MRASGARRSGRTARPRSISTRQNRNKRSVALDLKLAADIEKLHQLCETADILIQNLRPGVVDEIGIGPEAMLRAIRG